MAATGQGKLTPQYKCVQQNYAKLTELLQTIPGIRTNLTAQLTAEGWFVPGSPNGPTDLVNLVLTTIQHNAAEYDNFIAMLQQCGGAEHIVTALLGAVH